MDSFSPTTVERQESEPLATRRPPGAPPLTAKHLDNARLFANRSDLVAGLRIPQGGIVAELGVVLGEFSISLIKLLEPREFVAVDAFVLHQLPSLWGRPTDAIFQRQSHRDFYQKELAGSPCTVTLCEGVSQTMLEAYPNRYFDMIYINSDHSYNATKENAAVAMRKVRQDGVLVFNDYALFDPFSASYYGVVPAVNELVVNEGYRVVGFALQEQMYCNIALRPPAAGLITAGVDDL